MQRIIAVNRFCWPDHSATSQLLADLAEHLAGQGREVVIVASRLRYDDAAAALPAEETHEGVRIHRVWTSAFGRHFLPGRAVDYLTFYLMALVALLRLARPGDTILAKTDPPLLSVVAWLAAKARGAKLVNWCQDLFPEVAAALGMGWAAGPAGRMLRALRNRSLRAAEANVALCGRMAEHLAGEGVPQERIRIVHNWPDAAIRPVPREANALRREWGLEGKFVLGYSGNLGRAHAPGAVLELVRSLRHMPNLCCLFIGGGAGIERLKAAAAEEGLDHLRFQPYQPRERLAESLSVPDLHLVSLDPSCEGLLMPSKIYGILAAGRPILFLGEAAGAVPRLPVPPGPSPILHAGAPAGLRRELLSLANDPARLARLGSSARTAYETAFTPDAALRAWAGVLGVGTETSGAARREAA
ncbi:glycosyltransferase family 4 protein [Geminicoccaceae bacterium 1502E]|nr:glycosyltransferase family 4 protein [Geminicoccaceae bacterium 1502E]